MRTQISVVLFSLGALMGCGIEEKINDAGEKCEDKIYEALEHVEDVCLTKDQIWELLYEVRGYGVETSPRCEEGDVR